jgi:Na+-driven multidrug efflux pump
MKIILIGFFFRPFAMLFHNLIRAEGNAPVPMTGMIIGAVLNTLLDAVFIIGFRLGIKGAAMATVVGEAATTLYFVSYYFSGRNFLHFKLRNFIIQWPVMREILSIGVSAFTMAMSTSLSVVFVNKMCAAYGGDMAVSAFGIINRLIMLALMPGLVVGMGLQPIVGFNYGAKRFERILRAISISAVVATFFCTVSFVLGCFIPEIFVKIFTSDETLIALTVYAIKRIFSAIFIVGLIFVITTIFQALGKAAPAFFTSIARPVIFFIPLLYILPRYIKLDGVWWAFPFADILTFLLATTLVLPQIKELLKKREESAYHSIHMITDEGEDK